MNSAASTMPRWLKVLLWAGGFFFLGLATTVVWVYRTLHLSPEARELKGAMLGSLSQPVSSQIQFSVGSVALCAARQIVSRIDDVPPEAVAALDGVKAASVGVFQLGHHPNLDPDVFRRCDERMRRGGWHRSVSVKDKETTVVIYTPKAVSERDLKVCLAVIDGAQLVVVSGRIDGRKLVPIVAERASHELALR